MSISYEAQIEGYVKESDDGFTLSRDVPGIHVVTAGYTFPTKSAAKNAIRIAHAAYRAGRDDLQEEMRDLLNAKKR